MVAGDIKYLISMELRMNSVQRVEEEEDEEED